MTRVATSSARHANALLRDIVRLFLQAQRTMTACCTTDATAKECEALMLIGRDEAPTVQEFAARMGLEKTWASRLVTRLEKRKLIRRVDHPADGRSTLIELTATGRREFDALNAALDEHAVNLLGCVPAAQRAGVEQALGHLRDALATCLDKCGADKRGCGSP